MTASANPSSSRGATLISGYRGLAETLIQTFVDAGQPVSVLVRNKEAIEGLKKKYPKSYFHYGDTTSKQAIGDWLGETLNAFKRIDTIINNAAITGPGGKLHEISFEAFEQTIAVDLLSPIYVCQQALKIFLEQGNGTIINLSGGGATHPRPHFAAYATAKCGLVRMTETLAHEYPQFRFYAMSPGFLKTPMVESVLKLDPKKIGKEYDEAKVRCEQGGEDPRKAAKLALWLSQNHPQMLSGKLISAIWDDYQNATEHPKEIGWWTLRRIDEVCLKNLKSLL